MGGVSGAFVLLPFQVSILGYTTPSVSATNQVFNIVAIPSGIYRYIKEGRMLWPLSKHIIIGTLPGVFIGAWIRIEYLPNPKNFKLFVSFVLIYIGWKLLLDIIRKYKRTTAHSNVSIKSLSNQVKVIQSTLRNVRFLYSGEEYSYTPLQIFILCFVVGIVGGIYGIGGGSIISPFLVAMVGLPVYTIAGAALSGTFVTSIAGVLFFHILARFYQNVSVSPDWLLGGLFGLGGFLGRYLGARTQQFIPSRLIKGILCICTLFVAIKYILDFL